MGFVAKYRNARFSPYKLRPLADVVRGKPASYALRWLSTCALKKAVPLKKVIKSAADSAKYLKDINLENLIVKDIRVDEGRTFRYFKPGSMGRANVYRRRSCHISVELDVQDKKD